MQTPMRIAVAGATGRVGHHVVDVLARARATTSSRSPDRWAST